MSYTPTGWEGMDGLGVRELQAQGWTWLAEWPRWLAYESLRRIDVPCARAHAMADVKSGAAEDAVLPDVALRVVEAPGAPGYVTVWKQ